MKNLIAMLALCSACSAAVEGAMPMGDDGTPPEDMPPGDDDPGPMTESATVKFQFTTIRDERNDAIDFSTGEPVHTHGGPMTTLGGANCPDVYKYSYLMDHPDYGDETTANPFAWKVELKNVASAQYRVRSSHGTNLFWTDLSADGVVVIERSDVQREGQYFLDIRTGDTITSACWNHHPLAPPIDVKPIVVDPGFAGMTLAANSPISTLLGPNGVVVLSQRFTQYVAEPVTLVIDVAQPTGTYTKRVVDDFVVTARDNAGITCYRSADEYVNDDPACSATPPDDPAADPTTSGPFVNLAWSLFIIDEFTAQQPCGTVGLHSTCTLPARSGAPRSYRVMVIATNVGDLAPAEHGPFAEHTIGGLSFTGRYAGETVQRCAKFHSVVKFEQEVTTCVLVDEYTRIQALDRAKIDFNAITVSLAATSDIAKAAAIPLAHVPAAVKTIDAFAWDAGDDDLPGPQ